MGSLIRVDFDHSATTPFRRGGIRFLEAVTTIGELPPRADHGTNVCAVVPPAPAQPPPIPPPRPRTPSPASPSLLQRHLRMPPVVKPAIELPARPQPLPVDAPRGDGAPVDRAPLRANDGAAPFVQRGSLHIRGRDRRIAICALAVACGVGVGIVSLRIANRSLDRDRTVALPPIQLPAPPPPTPASIACVPPPAPSMIRVRVISRPSGAAVFLDGDQVGVAPLDLTLDRSTVPRAVKLRRSGHHSESLTFVPERDTELRVTMQPRRPAS